MTKGRVLLRHFFRLLVKLSPEHLCKPSVLFKAVIQVFQQSNISCVKMELFSVKYRESAICVGRRNCRV